ncbi:hypothetical protein [Succinivibrio sp.]|uniref:hypothetical protein n=1 Tax=Succinivibrio sp. TaxID=2053619 RepID=UPI0025CE7D5E|nr:hypothetical protein [Succinivibrio sp.]MBQ9220148.1 hypothetical protein [Succinivibrio sp.]
MIHFENKSRLYNGFGYVYLLLTAKVSGIEEPTLLEEQKSQLKQMNYGRIFHDYKSKVLVIGINYDKDTKEHQCLIEKYHN